MNGIPMEYGYCLTIIDFSVSMTLDSACAWLARGPLGRVGTSQRVFVMIKWILTNVLEREKLMGSNACTSVSGSLMRRWDLFLTFFYCIGPVARDPIRMIDPILRKKRKSGSMTILIELFSNTLQYANEILDLIPKM